MNPARRISLTGSPEQVVSKAASVRAVRSELRLGAISPEEAGGALARRLHGVVTVKEAWTAYEKTLRANWLKQARSTYAHRLAPTLGRLACAELTELVLRQWEAEEAAKGLAPATINNAFNMLKAMVRLMIKDHRVAGVPWGDYRPPAPHPLREREACRSVEELELLVMAAMAWDKETRAKGRYSDLAFRVLVMCLCGLRQGEAAGLGWARIELETPLPVIRIVYQAVDRWRETHPEWDYPQDPVKGRDAKRQIQRLHPSAVQALLGQRENLESHGLYRPDGPVFPGRGGAWRTHSDCIDCEDFKLLVRRAGLPNVDQWVPHSLRHSFGTLELVANGGDIKATMARMRHTRPETLEDYLHSTGRGLPVSAVPELRPVAMPTPPPRQLPPAGGLPPELRPFVVPRQEAQRARDLVLATTTAAHESEERRLEEKRQKRRVARQKHFRRSMPDYHEVYARWDKTGVRPPEVTQHAENARQRARAAWLRKHPGEETVANERGRRACVATLAGWAAFLKKKTGRPAQMGLEL